MALQSTRASVSAPARRAVVCSAVQPRAQRPQFASQLLAAGLAVGITFSGAPAMAASKYATLADIVRPTFGFVDENKDGVITKDELVRTSQQVAEDVDFMLPDDTQLDFAMRLFDLNQDGVLATDEMLTSIALDGAVAEDAIDSDVVAVFDKDSDGFVTLREFKSGLPQLGPYGEETKEYVFGRVDQMVNADKRLDQQEFANALTLMRSAILGY